MFSTKFWYLGPISMDSDSTRKILDDSDSTLARQNDSDTPLLRS